MKCHVNIQLSTEVCHILTKKSLSPFSFSSFSFPLFPSFSFCSSLPHFSFFSPAPFPPPLAIVFCTIYTPASQGKFEWQKCAPSVINNVGRTPKNATVKNFTSTDFLGPIRFNSPNGRTSNSRIKKRELSL